MVVTNSKINGYFLVEKFSYACILQKHKLYTNTLMQIKCSFNTKYNTIYKYQTFISNEIQSNNLKKSPYLYAPFCPSDLLKRNF